MTEHKQILQNCAATIVQRVNDYGEATENFKRTADIASLILSKTITEYDVAMIMVAVKLARLHASRDKRDTYEDAINYMAFGAEFAAPDPLESMASDIAKMYAPKRAQEMEQ